MKKSVEILGLPIISITEGRELGTSKTLLIDAKNRVVAAITIEDDDWYRGVKLIPYESVIAIGEDAVTITHSENILTLEEAGDYERFLDENIRVIGTKAITKTGRIQGKVTEVFVGEGGRIVKCEITTPDGSIDEVDADQISIFGKQVTVVDIDTQKKNDFLGSATPAFEPAQEIYSQPTQSTWTPPANEEPVNYSEPVEVISQPVQTEPLPPEETFDTTPDEQQALEEGMTPEPEAAVDSEPFTPYNEEPVEEIPQVDENPQLEVEENPDVVPSLGGIQVLPEMPGVNEQPAEDSRLTELTQQAEELRKAVEEAQNNSSATPEPVQEKPEQKTGGSRKSGTSAFEERRRRVLLGKHATKTIMADSGTIVVEAGAEVTEEVLQRARLANKFIELSMNVQ